VTAEFAESSVSVDGMWV